MYNIHALWNNIVGRISGNVMYGTNIKDTDQKGCLHELLNTPPYTFPPPPPPIHTSTLRYFYIIPFFTSRVLSIQDLPIVPNIVLGQMVRRSTLNF